MRHTNESIDQLLVDRGIARMTDFATMKIKVLWKCHCGYEWMAVPDAVIGKKKSGCPKCAGKVRVTNDDVDVVCKSRNITRCGDVISNNVPVPMLCNVCNHIWHARPAKLIHAGTGCPKCANKIRLTNDDIDARCVGLGVRRVGDYRSIHTKLMWECVICNHRWSEKPSNVLNKHTDCPNCRVPSYSKASIQWLTGVSNKLQINIQHAENGGEFIIPGTRYKVDGFCEATNTVYEFYGDMWHGNPAVYAADVFCSPFHKETAGELYTRTMEREIIIKSKGYNVVSIWEKDFNEQ